MKLRVGPEIHRRLRGKAVADGDDGNTYRTAVTVEFPEGIWVLDVFEKLSSYGIGTPKKDIDRIHARLARLDRFRETPEGERVIDGMRTERARAQEKIERERPKIGPKGS